MYWKKWLKMAMINQLRIVDWPADVVPPGPRFEIRSLRTTDLRKLVGSYIEYKLNNGPDPQVPKLERWTEGQPMLSSNFDLSPDMHPLLDEISIPTESARKGLIPLVVSQHGNPLRTLADCPEWRKSIEKARKKAEKLRKQTGGLIDHDRPDSGNSETFHAEPCPRRSPTAKQTKRANPSHIDPFDLSASGSGQDSENSSNQAAPGPSRSKTKHRHHHISKKRSHSQHASDEDSEDSDTTITSTPPRKKSKESKEKKGRRHDHKIRNPEHRYKPKKVKYHHVGKVPLLVQLNFTHHDSQRKRKVIKISRILSTRKMFMLHQQMSGTTTGKERGSEGCLSRRVRTVVMTVRLLLATVG
jgi:hypothetical protein